MDVSDLPISRLVRKNILQSLTPEDRQRVKLGPALRRQHCGKIVLENAQRLDATEMQQRLPRGSRVIVTDVGCAALASRIEVCFLLQDRRKCACFVLTSWIGLFVWVAVFLRDEMLEVSRKVIFSPESTK